MKRGRISDPFCVNTGMNLPDHHVVDDKKWWEKPDLYSQRRLRMAPTSAPIDWLQVAGLVELIVFVSKQLESVEGPKRMVEIGSWMGESGSMFAGSKIFDTITLIDPWFNTALAGVCEFNMRKFPNVTMVKGKSLDVAKNWKDQLDFVYIDGDHSYEGVKSDLDAWYPFIKTGGVISGHDYVESGNLAGVKKAVDEKFGEEAVKVFLDKSWLIVKR